MNVDVQVSCHPHIVRADYRFLQRLGSKLLVISCVLLVTGSIAVAQTWQHEMLDSGSDHDVGQFSALAIDRDGNLHAAYWDATGNAPRGQLWYTFRAPGDKQWSRMVVDGDGTFVSMAVDGSDHPHIAYSSKRETGLHYAHFDGKKWQKQIIDPGKVNYYNQIQVDANGHPRISYYLYHMPTGEYWLRLKYAYFDGKSWYIQTADPRKWTGKMNSLALDAEGNPYISYSYLTTTHDLFFAHYDGTHWQYGAPDLTTNENTLVSYGNCIAVDSKGHPHIVYFDNTKNNVKYASWDGTRWILEVVDHLVSLNELDHISLRMDHQDHAHIAYYDAGLGILKYAVREASGWRKEVVDHEGNVGLRPSLTLDAHDQPYISYYDLTNHALRLAYRHAGPEPVVADKR